MNGWGPESWPDSLWRATAEPLSLPATALPASADVVIIGAGYSGLWTALHVLREQPGLSVVVLERTAVGFGASGRNGGWVSALFPTSPEKLAAASSKSAALAMRKALRDVVDDLADWSHEEHIDCEYAKGGTITVARNAAQRESLRAEVEHQRDWGSSDTEFLDAAATAEHVRIQGTEAGMYTPHCAVVHPLKLARGLARAVTARGGVIVEQCTALSYKQGVVSTDHGVISCGSVVRATEGFTARFEAHLRELMPIYSLMIATEPLRAEQWEEIGLARRESFTEQRHVVIYGQRTADGRLAFGGRGAPYHWASAVDARFDQHPRVHTRLQQTLTELFPSLQGVRITHRWGGALGIPRDYFPFVNLEDGIGVMGGYVGDGVAAAALAGRTMAELLLGRTSDRTALPWVNRHTRRWEPEPLRWLEANGMLAGLTLADAQEARSNRPSRLADLLYRLL